MEISEISENVIFRPGNTFFYEKHFSGPGFPDPENPGPGPRGVPDPQYVRGDRNDFGQNRSCPHVHIGGPGPPGARARDFPDPEIPGQKNVFRKKMCSRVEKLHFQKFH